MRADSVVAPAIGRVRQRAAALRARHRARWTRAARAAGLVPRTGGSAVRAVLRSLDEFAPEEGADTVVVVTDVPDGPWGSLPGAEVLDLSRTDASALHVELAAAERRAVIVLDVVRPAERLHTVVDVLFHLRRGGRLVVTGPPTAREDGAPHPVVEFLHGVLAGDAGTGAWAGLDPDDTRRVAAAIDGVVERPGHVVVAVGRTAYAKIDEPEIDAVLARTGRGRVLATRPGARWCPTAPVAESGATLAAPWRREYDAPPLRLRSYDDVVCRPNQVITQGRLLLPDTYRHLQRPRLINKKVRETTRLFGVPRERGAPRRRLEGPHFYWDSQYRGHFGHVMTEQLSRLWALAEARAAHPDLKVLMMQHRSRDLTAAEARILRCFGVERDDVVLLAEPVEVERVLAATPAFSQPMFVHPEIAGVWDHLARSLLAAAPGAGGVAADRLPRRIFIGRDEAKRRCLNGAEVEALFVARGFTVVRPEQYPLAEQARIFHEADVVAGYAGSGMFGALLSERPTHLVLISSASYHPQNEWMIAALRGHRVDVAWCTPDPEVDAPVYDRRLFHADFTCEEPQLAFLREVLDGLDPV